MSDPIGFYKTFQGLLRGQGIEAMLTSGMACVEYGLQQNTKDTDWIVEPSTIASLVNAASASQNPVIVVPGGTLQLNYASVDAVGSSGASFSYSLGSNGWLNGAANCSQGLLNGQVPQTADQAQLLNAVCAVAYGSGG